MTLRDKLETKALQRSSKPGAATEFRQWVVDSAEIRPESNVIDIATATGGMAFTLHKKTPHVTGIDASSERIDIAKNDERSDGIEFLVTDAGETTFSDGEFDIAFIVLGLHEMGVDGSQRVLKETRRIAKSLVVVEFGIDRWPLLWSFLRYPLALFEAPGFLRFTRQNLESLLEKTGWIITKKEARFPYELIVCR
jgi:demethylmenaquinone methyltransferase/2-methoxy-6-polyprenyl-1,4-benzoquinol methylase